MTAYLKVTIDGDVVMDGHTGTWEQRQPEFIVEQLDKMTNGTPAPYMRALMLVIAEAAMTQTYTEVEVEVEVKTSGSGWSLDTRYSVAL